MTEKDLYKQARKQDAHWYTLALIIIVIGFFTTEIFSAASMIPSLILGGWAFGIARMGKLQSELLNESEPVVTKLVSQGFTEHDAMVKVGIDKFYYKPFWAIR